MKKILLITWLFMSFSQQNVNAQKKALTFDEILKWNRITETRLSNNGKFIVYKEEPWKGDPVLKITYTNAVELATFKGGTDAVISSDSKCVVFNLKAPEDSVRILKLKGAKKDELPKDKLVIYNLEQNTADTIASLHSRKVPEKWEGWIFYQVEVQTDKTEKEKKDDKTFPLCIYRLSDATIDTIPAVSSYEFAEENSILTFVSEGDSTFDAGVYRYDLKKNSKLNILPASGKIKQLTVNKTGDQLAFLADTTDKKEPEFSVYFWKNEGQASIIMDNANNALPDDWEISENGKLNFSENNERLFLGTAPKKTPRDTTILEEEIPVLDVWRWNDEILQTQQLNTKDRDAKKTYLAVIHLNRQKVVQLETEEFTETALIDKGNADYVLAYSNRPYAIQSMWEGEPHHYDYYLVDIQTGKSTRIKQDCRARPMTSPAGKYIYWYNATDTTWNSFAISSRKEYKLTDASMIQLANELNDVPNFPGSYRFAGWLEEDEAFLVYDRYDLWKVDPENENTPVRLTPEDRLNKLSYRLLRFNIERNEAINKDEFLLLKSTSDLSKADTYYTFNPEKPEQTEQLFSGNYKLNNPLKAKESDLIVFTKQNFGTYPDLLATNVRFSKIVQISDAAPQQRDYFWGTAELVSWRSLDGLELEGTLHKPENFDPNKKYPMIVNFYEKSSDELLSYHMPENHRSTIDYHYYTSNGYLVFNPDVYYKEGYPGESAFNCVMPGVTHLIDQGFVDEKRIGAQGHSWGGYQVAYLATRTNMFAAIESGAPVVNMFSAYGGIRWGSGLNRAFQYEHTQSRIGKSIWDAPLRYLENSPLFTLDKIETPILIMHNDDDGAVPWYQGIEFFIGMRRLGKPAWLLNYNEADHWPTKIRDKHDFQIRMAQFFDHYLKGAPMPKWMGEGIPATKKGVELGYEVEE